MTLTMLQDYWWMLISVLGAILVFMLFVQGGQTFLLCPGNGAADQSKMISSLGHKWELTFTTLVVFGGAFFASFPLFYSTSFGGAYWLWILILFSFVLQAVSYEYRKKPGNLLGTRVYDIFLFINGSVGCILLGVAVAMFFFGAEFTVTKANLVDSASPVISHWDNPLHGFEAIFNWRNLLLGFAVLFLARVLSELYLLNTVLITMKFYKWIKSKLWVDSILFLVFFLAFVVVLFTSPGFTVVRESWMGLELEITPHKYWLNLIYSPSIIILLVVGVANVLMGICVSLFTINYHHGIWFAGIGTFFTVVALFWLAGFCDTPFLPSLSNPESSLTIRNASSTEFTLQCMTWVSILVPFVVAYIWYVWRAIDRRKISEADAQSEH